MSKHGCSVLAKTNVASLRDSKSPKNEKLRSLLEVFNMYCQLVDDFTGWAHLLNKLLKKGVPGSFTFDADQKRHSKALSIMYACIHFELTEGQTFISTLRRRQWLRNWVWPILNTPRWRMKIKFFGVVNLSSASRTIFHLKGNALPPFRSWRRQ